MRHMAILKPVVHAEANRLVVVRDRARCEDQRPLVNVYLESGRCDQRPFRVLPQGGLDPVHGSAHGQHAPHVVICQHSIAHGGLPMISRNPAPFSAFVTRYHTTVGDCMVSWFPTHTGGRAPVKLGALCPRSGRERGHVKLCPLRRRSRGEWATPCANTVAPDDTLWARVREHGLEGGTR